MFTILVCKQCTQEFKSKPSANRKFCSKKCYNLSRIGKPTWNKGLTKAENPSVRRTSLKITGRVPWNKGKPWSKEIKQKISEAKKGCASSFLGKRLSLESRQKISTANKNRKRTDEQKQRISEGHKGIMPWNNGLTKETSESLRKMAEEKREFLSNKENHPNWHGGVSFEPYSVQFDDALKDRIRERDNHICQLCGEKANDQKIDIHHIDYDKKNNAFNNLIALCRACNVKVNYDRGKWEQFFSS